MLSLKKFREKLELLDLDKFKGTLQEQIDIQSG